MINTRIWNDNWVSHLDPVEKLLFIYLLTNEHTNLSGIYELPLRVIAAETGIDHAMIMKMVIRLSPKVYYEDGWVIIKNFPRHQSIENPKIMAGIQRELALLPPSVYTLSIGYGYPITLNLTRLNLSVPAQSAEPSYEIREETSSVKEPEDDPRITAGYKSMIAWAESQRGFPFLKGSTLKQFKALKVARESGIKSTPLKERWVEFSEDEFWKDKGFDWMDVVRSFNKRA